MFNVGERWRRFNAPLPGETPVEWCIRVMTVLPRTLSLSPLPQEPPTPRDLRRIDFYVLGWTPVLIGLSLAETAGWDAVILLACALALYRWAEILATQLGMLLVSTRVQPAPGCGSSPAPAGQPVRGSAQRGLELGLVNLLQLIIAFSILSQAVADADKDSFHTMPTAWFDHLYLSWTNVLTLGNSFSPQSVLARMLVMAQVGSGLLMIGITFAAILGRFGEAESRHTPNGAA